MLCIIPVFMCIYYYKICCSLVLTMYYVGKFNDRCDLISALDKLS